MRVLFVSTSYPQDDTDWRGVFMRHLVNAIARMSDVEVDAWLPPGVLPRAVTAVMTPGESQWLTQLMMAGGVSHLMRVGGMRAWSAPLRLLSMLREVYRRRSNADVYHINWLQCALPLPANGKPALITVLGNDLKLLRLPLVPFLLRRVMRRHEIVLCPNAEWMIEPLRAAFGEVARIVPVPFGIEPRWYAIERNIRPERSSRWLVVTRLTADKLGPLFDWSKELFANGRNELHLFGPMQESIQVPAWVHYHGAVSADELAARWFPHAQGLITLSRHAEGRPQVMLEAMAAGLPIIASRLPAHADIVKEGTTGALCDSPTAYAAALDALTHPERNTQMGHAARSWAQREIGTWDDCATRYLKVYQQLLGQRADG